MNESCASMVQAVRATFFHTESVKEKRQKGMGQCLFFKEVAGVKGLESRGGMVCMKNDDYIM